MDFETVAKKRRMCREYLDREVLQEKVGRILDLASRYPSAGHTQPQEFVVVRDQRAKEALALAALDQMYVAQAPLIIYRGRPGTRRSAPRYGKLGVEIYSVIDGSFAAMLVLLAVVDEGLGACFAGAFYDKEVRHVLGLPRGVHLIGIISIGYCAEGPQKFLRRPRTPLIHHDRYGNE
jgi:nitroreductase